MCSFTALPRDSRAPRASAGCIVNQGFQGGGERLKSGTVTPEVDPRAQGVSAVSEAGPKNRVSTRDARASAASPPSMPPLAPISGE